MRKTFLKGIVVTALATVLTASGSLCAFAASSNTVHLDSIYDTSFHDTVSGYSMACGSATVAVSATVDDYYIAVAEESSNICDFNINGWAYDSAGFPYHISNGSAQSNNCLADAYNPCLNYCMHVVDTDVSACYDDGSCSGHLLVNWYLGRQEFSQNA